MKSNSKKNKVIFAGAGPGALDLITLRCFNAIKEADLIIFAGSLINPQILTHAKESCRILDSSKMSLPDIISEIKIAYKQNKKILRLHTGDPAIYGAIAEQILELDKLNIPYEIIPGVSSFFAAASALKTELTTPEISQTVILTRTPGKTLVPHGQELKNLARHKATIVLFLSAPLVSKTITELLEGGCTKDTPVALVYKASWHDQKIIRGTLANIENKIKRANINKQAIIFVGDVLSKKNWRRSKLYDPYFSHAFRTASKGKSLKDTNTHQFISQFTGSAAIFTLTEKSLITAKKIQLVKRDYPIFAPLKLKEPKSGKILYYESLKDCIEKNWSNYSGLIFIMATGIVMRYIAPLLTRKTIDPAVVVCDQLGNFCISLLSGHLGGANRLASDLAKILGAQEVITTATDTEGLIAFDELAFLENYKILNPDNIKIINSAFLENKKIALCLPKSLYKKYYSSNKNLANFANPDEINQELFYAIVSTKKIHNERIPTLYLEKNES